MLRTLPFLVLAGWSATLFAQARPPICHPIDGATTIVFAVTFAHGLDHDQPTECGAARVLLRCRLLHAERAAPATRTAFVHVGGDLALAVVQVDAGDWALGAAFVRALLDGADALGDDAIELAAARAALVADDAEWLYPGPALQCRARSALLGARRGHPVQGSAEALQRLTPDRVRQLLRRPVAVDVLAFGAVPPAVRDLTFGGDAPRTATSAVTPTSPPTYRAPAEPELRPHPRVDAPFAAIAFRAPPPVHWPAFAVGVEVARLRALRRLPRVADQAMARAPAVAWSWLEGDPVVVFCRRGRDGDPPAAAFAELEGLLDDLRQRPPSERELETARRALLGELAPLPWSPELVASLRGSPAALSGRVSAAVRSLHRGITPDAIADVTEVMAHEVLRSTLVSERAWRGALVPSASPPAGRRPETAGVLKR